VAVLQAVPRPMLDLPNVPLAINYAKTDEARKLIEVGIHSTGLFARPFVTTPGTPKDRVQLLRNASKKHSKTRIFWLMPRRADWTSIRLPVRTREGCCLGFQVGSKPHAKLKEILLK